MAQATKAERIETTWEAWGYDVWGNATDGYEVNDRRCWDRARVMSIPTETHNIGTAHEFTSAYPTDGQIRNALGLGPRIKLDIDGDDLVIYVARARDGYPLGELHCTSHESLSPIRARATEAK